MVEYDDGLNGHCLWRGVKGAEYREFVDELLVYVGTTADTHLLEFDAAAVLVELVESPVPLSAAQLHAALSDPDAGMRNDEQHTDEVRAVTALLMELQRSGLASCEQS